MYKLTGIALICALGVAAAPARSLVGSWCVVDHDLVITFLKGDSLLVSGEGDFSINGAGTYQAGDTLFSATLVNGDVTVELGYQYRWESDSVVMARPRFVLLNKNSFDHPTEWMKMKRCAKKVVATEASAPARSRSPDPDAGRIAPTSPKENKKKR